MARPIFTGAATLGSASASTTNPCLVSLSVEAASNTYVLAGVHVTTSANTLSAVTFAGLSMSAIGVAAGTAGFALALYGVANAPPGLGVLSVALQGAAATGINIGAWAFTGVDPTIPLEVGAFSGSGVSLRNLTLSTELVNGLVFGVQACGGTPLGAAMALSGGTELSTLLVGARRMEAYILTAAASPAILNFSATTNAAGMIGLGFTLNGFPDASASASTSVTVGPTGTVLPTHWLGGIRRTMDPERAWWLDELRRRLRRAMDEVREIAPDFKTEIDAALREHQPPTALAPAAAPSMPAPAAAASVLELQILEDLRRAAQREIAAASSRRAARLETQLGALTARVETIARQRADESLVIALAPYFFL